MLVVVYIPHNRFATKTSPCRISLVYTPCLKRLFTLTTCVLSAVMCCVVANNNTRQMHDNKILQKNILSLRFLRKLANQFVIFFPTIPINFEKLSSLISEKFNNFYPLVNRTKHMLDIYPQ